MKALIYLVILLAIPTHILAEVYSAKGSQILKDGTARQFRGVNALHEYGVGSSDMNPWRIEIVRETIHNFQSHPITGGSIQIGGSWKHSLQKIVDDNRANGKITIICPFNWDGLGATDFLAKNPSSQVWFEAYKTRYQAVANQFKNQGDVWFDVWNEPYWWNLNDARGYSESLWLSDMGAMVDNIRSTGATNIILVPGSQMGQGETVVLNRGLELLSGRANVVFGLHAYEAWLHGSQSQIENRIAKLQSLGLPLLFSEYGAKNNETMDVANFLAACRSKKVGALAWIWKKSDSEQGALLRASGTTPNDANNFLYGSKVKEFCSKAPANSPGDR